MESSETKSTFETLEVWKKARELRKETAKFTQNLPDVEKYRLCDQMIRASRSVTANIAEGYGRFHYLENMRFCRHARGSLFELLDHFTVAQDEEYITDEQFEYFRNKIFEVVKILNGYIKYLKNRKATE